MSSVCLNEPMKRTADQAIILDGRHIQDHFPGIARYAFNLAEALARVAPEADFRILHSPRLRNTRYDISSLAKFPNVELVRIDVPPFSPREQWLGLNRALTSRASLWHSAYYVMPYFLPVPAAVTLEDVLPLIRLAEIPNPGKRLLYRALNLLAGRRAAHILTISHSAAADLQRLFGFPRKKITVTYLAADKQFQPAVHAEIERMREKLNLPARYALYVGSNKPHKNLVRLVQAWARVQTEAVLVLAGHWDERYPEAKRQVGELGLQSRVFFRQNVSHSDLPSLYAGAQLFVFPSTYEGFGLPPLEAMACGSPVVCANVSSLPEVVGEAAVLFDPLDGEALASALTRLLEDSGLRDTLRAQGMARARRFTWERTAEETLKAYRIAAEQRAKTDGRI
jgi:glycosyltransferase involved in cell wall biosynthesis